MSVVRCENRNGEVPLFIVACRIWELLGRPGNRIIINVSECLPADWSNAVFCSMLTNPSLPRRELFEFPEAGLYRHIFQAWLQKIFGQLPSPENFHFFLCDNVRLDLIFKRFNLTVWDAYAAYVELHPILLYRDDTMPASIIALMLLTKDHSYLSEKTVQVLKYLLLDYCRLMYGTGYITITELAREERFRHIMVFGS